MTEPREARKDEPTPTVWGGGTACGGCTGAHRVHNQGECLWCTCQWQRGIAPMVKYVDPNTIPGFYRANPDYQGEDVIETPVPAVPRSDEPREDDDFNPGLEAVLDLFDPPSALSPAERWIESLHEDANGLVWTTKAELRAALSTPPAPDPKDAIREYDYQDEGLGGT